MADDRDRDRDHVRHNTARKRIFCEKLRALGSDQAADTTAADAPEAPEEDAREDVGQLSDSSGDEAEEHARMADTVRAWIYAGDDSGKRNEYVLRKFPGLVFPDSQEHCVCGQEIKHNVFIVHRTTGAVAVIGSDCARRFLPAENRHKMCEQCGAVHRNRLNNLCAECRVKSPKDGTIVKGGKHEGRTFRELLTCAPDYCRWVVASPARPDDRTWLRALRNYVVAHKDELPPPENMASGGKHAGKSFVQILADDPSYCLWVLRQHDCDLTQPEKHDLTETKGWFDRLGCFLCNHYGGVEGLIRAHAPPGADPDEVILTDKKRVFQSFEQVARHDPKWASKILAQKDSMERLNTARVENGLNPMYNADLLRFARWLEKNPEVISTVPPARKRARRARQ